MNEMCTWAVKYNTNIPTYLYVNTILYIFTFM